jgi:hypothetical protein
VQESSGGLVGLRRRGSASELRFRLSPQRLAIVLLGAVGRAVLLLSRMLSLAGSRPNPLFGDHPPHPGR